MAVLFANCNHVMSLVDKVTNFTIFRLGGSPLERWEEVYGGDACHGDLGAERIGGKGYCDTIQ